MSGLLPPAMRCSAWWYAQARGLPSDLDSLLALGLAAARLARWYGLEEWRVQEGPYVVHMWPEPIWDEAALQPRAAALAPGPGFWEDFWEPPGEFRYDADVHSYPLPQGDQALRDIGY